MDTENFFISPINSVLCKTSKFGVQNYPEFFVTIITPWGNLDTGQFGHQMTLKINQNASNDHQINKKCTGNAKIKSQTVSLSSKWWPNNPKIHSKWPNYPKWWPNYPTLPYIKLFKSKLFKLWIKVVSLCSLSRKT